MWRSPRSRRCGSRITWRSDRSALLHFPSISTNCKQLELLIIVMHLNYAEPMAELTHRLNLPGNYDRKRSEIGWDVRVALGVYGSFSSRAYLNSQRLRYAVILRDTHGYLNHVALNARLCFVHDWYCLVPDRGFHFSGIVRCSSTSRSSRQQMSSSHRWPGNYFQLSSLGMLTKSNVYHSISFPCAVWLPPHYRMTR